MSKISAIDFANNVESNRKKLIQHCVENGKEVSSVASLDTVVGVTNTINETQPEGTYKVTYKDLDDTVLKVEYVQNGGISTPPETPNIDPDYLEFDYWAVSGGDDLNNITRDTLVLPQYKTKYSEALGQRPTYLICYLVDNLSPSLYFGSCTNTYVDWGDGSTAEQVSASTVSHTYTSEGRYIITIYGDSYQLGGTSEIFPTSYNSILKNAYIGENTVVGKYAFRNFYNLSYLVLNNSITSIPDYICSSCFSLGNIVVPNGVTSLGIYVFNHCRALTSIIIPSSVNSFGTLVFAYCLSMENIVLPDVTKFPDYMFAGCYKLRDVNIPNNLTTVGGHCFEKCYNIKKVILPTSVSSIGADAFSGCNSLEDVNIPEGVPSLIGQTNTVFTSCFALKYIKLPSSLINFRQDTFSGCWGLKFIELPYNFKFSLSIQYGELSDECLIDIANKLIDNSASSAQNIIFNTYIQQKLMQIHLDENGQQVFNSGESLLTIMQNKNWTVAFNQASPY